MNTKLATESVEPFAARAPAASLNGEAPRGRPATDRRRLELLGIPIDAGDPPAIVRTVLSWGRGATPRAVMRVNPDVVNTSRRLPELRRALGSADLLYCDSLGVRLAARALNLPVPPRMTPADWVWELAASCASSARSLYLVGAEPPLAREAAARLTRRHPALHIAGAYHGYADVESPQNLRLLEDINAKRPNIVLVGMGTPKQELWSTRYAAELDVDVLWTVGGAFHDIAGRPRRPARILAGNGPEWVLRLAIERRRVLRQQLVGNAAFVSHVMADARRRRGASR